jgi:hypothetical protein
MVIGIGEEEFCQDGRENEASQVEDPALVLTVIGTGEEESRQNGRNVRQVRSMVRKVTNYPALVPT